MIFTYYSRTEIPHEQKVTLSAVYITLSRAAEQLTLIYRRNFRYTILWNPLRASHCSEFTSSVIFI